MSGGAAYKARQGCPVCGLPLRACSCPQTPANPRSEAQMAIDHATTDALHELSQGNVDFELPEAAPSPEQGQQ